MYLPPPEYKCTQLGILEGQVDSNSISSPILYRREEHVCEVKEERLNAGVISRAQCHHQAPYLPSFNSGNIAAHRQNYKMASTMNTLPTELMAFSRLWHKVGFATVQEDLWTKQKDLLQRSFNLENFNHWFNHHSRQSGWDGFTRRLSMQFSLLWTYNGGAGKGFRFALLGETTKRGSWCLLFRNGEGLQVCGILVQGAGAHFLKTDKIESTTEHLKIMSTMGPIGWSLSFDTNRASLFQNTACLQMYVHF